MYHFKSRNLASVLILLVVTASGYQNCSNEMAPFRGALSSNSTTDTGNNPSADPNNNNSNTPPPPPVPAMPKLISVIDNKGPLFGDHSLKITASDIPLAGKKVEVKIGNQLCLNLKVVSATEINCITPSSAASKVDVSLLVDNVETSKLIMGYEYAPSESIVGISPNAVIPFRLYGTPAMENGNVYFWGGQDINRNIVAQGVVYKMATDSWENMETQNQPTPGIAHTAVSTGKEYIVWGGFTNAYTNRGGRYNFATKTWAPMSTVGAPSARGFATAVWTGTKMIVWGGAIVNNSSYNDGAIYDPTTDTWAPMANAPADIPGRWYHFAHWDGKEMLVWGGYLAGMITNGVGYVGAYDPVTNSWRRINLANDYTGISIDFGWTWYTGTKFMVQSISSAQLGDQSIPKYLDRTVNAWVNLPRGLLPSVNLQAEVARYNAFWSGRHLYLFKNGAGGFKYSFN